MENKVTTKKDLIKRILEQRERLSSFGVTSIGLFGSLVREEQTASSDIDILVEFTPEKHTFDNFDETLKRAFARSIEVIGEASKRLPEDIKAMQPDIEWRKVSGMRDRLIHDYFGIDYTIVWDV